MRGYEIIDGIETRVEASCNATVSCEDVLALAACDVVTLIRGHQGSTMFFLYTATPCSLDFD